MVCMPKPGNQLIEYGGVRVKLLPRNQYAAPSIRDVGGVSA
jgi:hypothetical protein